MSSNADTKEDIVTATDRGESTATMEPLLIGETSRHRGKLTDMALELAHTDPSIATGFGVHSGLAMGSILGDGSDFRQPLAAERAKKFLDNPSICAFFSHPRAFTPLQFADGDSFDQQLAFYLKTNAPGGKSDTPLLALFNFSDKQEFKKPFTLETLDLPKGKYLLKDFMTDTVLGAIEKDQDAISLTVPEKDAYLVKIIPIKE